MHSHTIKLKLASQEFFPCHHAKFSLQWKTLHKLKNIPNFNHMYNISTNNPMDLSQLRIFDIILFIYVFGSHLVVLMMIYFNICMFSKAMAMGYQNLALAKLKRGFLISTSCLDISCLDIWSRGMYWSPSSYKKQFWGLGSDLYGLPGLHVDGLGHGRGIQFWIRPQKKM
jgi:hypothetical protein